MASQICTECLAQNATTTSVNEIAETSLSRLRYPLPAKWNSRLDEDVAPAASLLRPPKSLNETHDGCRPRRHTGIDDGPGPPDFSVCNT